MVANQLPVEIWLAEQRVSHQVASLRNNTVKRTMNNLSFYPNYRLIIFITWPPICLNTYFFGVSGEYLESQIYVYYYQSYPERKIPLLYICWKFRLTTHFTNRSNISPVALPSSNYWKLSSELLRYAHLVHILTFSWFSSGWV